MRDEFSPPENQLKRRDWNPIGLQDGASQEVSNERRSLLDVEQTTKRTTLIFSGGRALVR
jgi:hypothetical protein